MSDVNLIMNNWYIPQRIPPINLGYSGENNAISLSIKIDNKINFETVEYYLDIMDRIDGEKVIATTQELKLEEIEEDGIISYYLKMNPSSEWLGRDGLKYLQVRCTYVDNSSDTLKNVTIKSNAFYGIVNLGLYP